MTFSELVEEVAMSSRLPKTVVSKVLKTFQKRVKEVLNDGEEVVLTGFGTFYSIPKRSGALFGGTRMSEPGRTVRFRLSRRKRMEKYAVVLDDEKTKTAGTDKTCPKCGREVEDLEGRPWCPTDGFEPFEKRPEASNG